MILTFLGHRTIYNCASLSKRIENAITKSIKPNEDTIFFCGGYGDFDNVCAEVCRSIKEKQPNCTVAFVTPYITEAQQKKIKSLIDDKLYDTSIYPPLENVPPKFAISKRNKWMISEADVVIAYVKKQYGGAYMALKYAQKRKKHIINLAE